MVVVADFGLVQRFGGEGRVFGVDDDRPGNRVGPL